LADASSVVGPQYEMSYLGEQITEGDKKGGSETYVLAYQFQPEGGTTHIGLAARWIERSGDQSTRKDTPDEAQAHVEIKLSW